MRVVDKNPICIHLKHKWEKIAKSTDMRWCSNCGIVNTGIDDRYLIPVINTVKVI